MMLHVLLATALSASPALPIDSVRNASKSGAARPDTTLLTLPAPTVTPSKQAPPPVVSPIALVGTGAPSNPAASSTASPSADNASPVRVTTNWATSVKSSTSVTSTAPADSSAKRAPTSAAAARPQHEVVQQARVASAAPSPVTNTTVATAAGTLASPTPSIPVAAPADASAVVVPKDAVTTTRVDARTVVSVKSSERIEPLYSVPLPTSRLRLGAPSAADSIVVFKRERTLTLYYRGVPVKSYFVALGSRPVGDKERAGDQRTPEGLFHINAHNPASKFHLALRISYPDDAHRARAAALGADPGGDIMIHGLPKEYSEAGKDHVANDWTNGCVALSNQEIEEIWRAVPDGTPVQIKP
jgi:lipoprotein-anchoring transpeptidase ErfK/SrfK